jgi:hypothetical protein
MTTIRHRFLLAVCALGFAAALPASAADGDKTEALLKEAKFDYKVMKPGIFRIVFETPEGVSMIYVEEVKMGWKDKSGEDVTSVSVFTQCASTPSDYKPSNALLTWIAEVNERLKFGSLSISKDKDGTTRYFRNASAFLKNLDMEQFVNLVAICHYQRFQIAKQIQAISDATK